MVRLAPLLGALALAASAAAAAVPVPPMATAGGLSRRQAATSLVYRFPSGAWVENLAVRADGTILVTRMDVPELWAVDPVAKQATRLHTFADAGAAGGIAELADGVYAVLAGQYSAAGGNRAGTWRVHRVDLRGASSAAAAAPNVTLVAEVKEATQLNGLAALSADVLLAGDMGGGALYAVSVATGASRLVLRDPSMAAGGFLPFGIDGVRYRDGYVYYTNIARNTFHRLAVDPATGAAAGSAQQIYASSPGDDFAFGPDGNAYIATNTQNSVIRVTPDGQISPVAQIASTTSAAFGRTEADKNVLYVGTSQGQLVAVPITL